MAMRMLVIVGPDVPKEYLDIQKIGEATKEYTYTNEMPPPGKEGANLSRSGWVFMDHPNTPDFSWPDYTVTVGTVELGSKGKDVTEKIAPTAALTEHLIQLYETLESDTEEE
jgi:hypothetical protein